MSLPHHSGHHSSKISPTNISRKILFLFASASSCSRCVQFFWPLSTFPFLRRPNDPPRNDIFFVWPAVWRLKCQAWIEKQRDESQEFKKSIPLDVLAQLSASFRKKLFFWLKESSLGWACDWVCNFRSFVAQTTYSNFHVIVTNCRIVRPLLSSGEEERYCSVRP